MSDISGVTAVLAALSDEDLLAVVLAASTGRPGLDRLHLVAAELVAERGHAEAGGVVSSTTDLPEIVVEPILDEPYGQVGAVPGIPIGGSAPGLPGYGPGGVPTWESVRDKVDQRFGTAQGMGELSSQTPPGRTVEEQWDARQKAARERLEQIRKSMRDE
ncbi:hypothetical protein [Nocardia sp. alder85J]|uniref:hypothetical protein n=1 Tax=Nocardia sp. alder85J TaxID=2862949 RepID=UPI001CD7CDD6|nr:hypothetical protein [Nocardia sp. alder85J]MCX4094360.1 hypothetical protein [Nocardia sp. alder85J]